MIIQISRRASIAANSGAKGANNSNHNKNERRHQEPHRKLIQFNSIPATQPRKMKENK